MTLPTIADRRRPGWQTVGGQLETLNRAQRKLLLDARHRRPRRSIPLRTMQRPSADQLGVVAKAVPSPPAAASLALTRLGFGPAPGDVAAFDALGGTDAARLTAWVDQQLDPASIDDSACDARIVASGFTTLGKPLTQLWTDHVQNDPPWEVHVQPFRETVAATFLRAIHSKRQLFELMVDFWHNHFNVYADDFLIAAVWVHSDRDVIRANALGNFRTMIEAVAKSTAMLHYLDNRVNSFEDPNENFAREMLELHGLGSAAYLGSMPQGDVPTDGDGIPIGYTEDDVVAAARCLTGWTSSDRWWDDDVGDTGEFVYVDGWHDHDPKTVLGLDLPASQGPMQDGLDLFDRVAEHPATARHVALKLCRRLVADFPSQSMLDAAAATFAANVTAPDQIAQTVRTIVLHPDFLGTWGQKVKRPFETVASAFRGMSADLPFQLDDGATDWFYWEYRAAGQPLFSWHPPNGYPDMSAAWNSTSPRVMSWRMGNFLVQVTDDSDVHYADILGQTPAGVRSATALVDFWTERMLGRPADALERDELIEFMAQGHNPNFDLPLDTDEPTQERLRTLVALIVMTPSFLWK